MKAILFILAVTTGLAFAGSPERARLHFARFSINPINSGLAMFAPACH
jgi:hypothetical protein